MMLTLGVWLCTAPLVLLVLGPLFGLKAAVSAAGAVLAGLALICWSACRAGVGTR